MKKWLWLVPVLFLVTILNTFLNLSEQAQVVYCLEPETPYIGQALRFLNTGYISYVDHPGTFTIELYALLLLPIKLFSSDFGSTLYVHFNKIVLYLRYFQLLLAFVSVGVLGHAVFSYSKNILFALLAQILLLGFSPIWFNATGVNPETPSLFLNAMMFLAAVRATQTSTNVNTKLYFCYGSLLALLLINKVTNAPSALFFFVWLVAHKTKIINYIKVFAAFLITSVVVFWPARYGLESMLDWFLRLSKSTGVHGGESKIDLLSQTITTLQTYWSSAPVLIVFNVVASIGVLFVLFKKRTFEIKLLLVATLMNVIVFLVFAKYPLLHYQLATFFVSLVVLVFVMSQIKLCRYSYPIVMAVLMIYMYLYVSPVYAEWNTTLVRNGKYVENLHPYIEEIKKENTKIVWQVLRYPEMLKHWINQYADGAINPKEEKTREQWLLNNINGDMKDFEGNLINIKSVCWQVMFVTDDVLNQLVKEVPLGRHTVTKMNGTDGLLAVFNQETCK